jgi:hypothetical protein
MLDHETVNKLRYMKLTGIAEALKEQDDDDAYQEMSFRDRFALLGDREFCKRQHGRLQRQVHLDKRFLEVLFKDLSVRADDLRHCRFQNFGRCVWYDSP